MWLLESDHGGRNRNQATRKRCCQRSLEKNGEMLLGCSGRTTLRREQCNMSGRPNYLRQEISNARQRIRIMYPRIQLTSPPITIGNCCI
jgi:hypothetical protein